MKIFNQNLSGYLLSGILVLTVLGTTACGGKAPSYTTMESKPSGANLRYMQLIDPTPAQIAAGQDALKKFKTASKEARNELGGDLLISKVLIGMSQKDLLDTLGPGEFSTDPKLVIYDITKKEKLCQLMIVIGLGKVSDVYIEAI
ncbi:MAG: hypothetical protein IPP57_05550 [Candidatus Obscuribacter sp.]|nr:hypothetical protein [Candidatus Obscuribacter sp.]MDQ5965561.1 hypothetical protein [Cyanobacteriota bacterium erpe_2018_sw_39hr_WHONDRS-SW48-000098_B_bin.30]MBK9206135.1 hypothetical protein [Candidatus Obscuribacter sp.]MBK9618050.1 hypothetical protein [Candidatus Obscuribacter sp.]MBK9770281.1 hypothetical protein [Candidatus Obscuribacter sp.]